MNFSPTAIPDVVLITPQVYGDERGFFMETYQASLFEEAGLPCHFVQDNHSGSRQGVLRGLHYQIHQAQGKLVRVVAARFSTWPSTCAASLLPSANGKVSVSRRRTSSRFGSHPALRMDSM